MQQADCALAATVLLCFAVTLTVVMASFEASTKKITGFNDLQLIDKGAFGKVYKAKDGDAEVAIKVVCLREHSNLMLKCDIVEILTHRCLQGGPNIVDFIHAFSDSGHVWIVLKLYKSSLRALLESPLDEAFARRTACGLLKGVAYMHARGFVHCDLKPENVLIDADGSAVVADFGLTTPEFLADPEEHTVTRFYRAPELACLLPWGCPVDLWSVGCILYEILAQCGAGVPQPNCLFSSKGSVLSGYEGSFDRTDLYAVLNVVGTEEPPYPALRAGSPLHRELYYAWRELPVARGVLADRYSPGCTAPLDGRTLVAQLLQLNPARRLTACRALRASFLETVPGAEAAVSAPRLSAKEAEQFERVFRMEAEVKKTSVAKRFKFDDEHILHTQLMQFLAETTS
jgi:serine/threonine protein kinase